MRDADSTPLDVAATVEVLAPILRPLASRFARILASEVAAELASGRFDANVDQRSSALAELRISSRVYLAGARAGNFPSSKRGRLVVARRRDVEAWLERRTRREAPRPAPEPRAIDDDVRLELGLSPRESAPLRAIAGGRKR